MHQHIDLVEGEVVLDLALETPEHGLAVAGEGVDGAAVFPAAVLFQQGHGQVEVTQSDERLDAVTVQGIDQLFVELQAGLVGLGILPGGEDAGPGDGEAVDFEPHFRKEGKVLFPAVVVVNG